MHFGLDSFSIGPTNPKRALLIVVLAVVGFGSPIVYLFYYGFCGGMETKVYREFQRIAAWDPEMEADRAIRDGDFALYSTGDYTDRRDVGLGGSVDEDYEGAHGRKWLAPCDRSQLTDEQAAVVERALKNLAVYNRLVYREGLRRMGK